MANDSQEQTICRSIANQIQLGFYDGGRFPSVQEIARSFGVSYCPAQRALKTLERSGLVRLCRGQGTAVLKKPYENYLGSAVFQARAGALADLSESLKVLSSAVAFQGLRRMELSGDEPPEGEGRVCQARRLYRWFERTLQAFGSQTVLSLYYDVSAFVGSAYLDILSARYGEEGAARLLRELSEEAAGSVPYCLAGDEAAALARLRAVGGRFFGAVEEYGSRPGPAGPETEPFRWGPHKGRARYCDVIAIDLVCKINQGRHPVGRLLPGVAELADTYHVSPVTIRRTIGILNQLGVTATINGVGTQVVFAGDASILDKRADLMLDDNLLAFLEALQLLAVTCEGVVGCAFPKFTEEERRALAGAMELGREKAELVSVTSACMQAVVHRCPLAALREIYEKITLQLLKGSVLRLGETGGETVPRWRELSGALRESLAAGDGALFARAFRRLAVENFNETRKTLLEMGVAGVERVAEPVEPPLT